MKSLLTLSFLLLYNIFSLEAQNGQPLEKGNYVINGAFKYKQNAKKLAQRYVNEGIEADYGFFPPKDLYYVYVLKTDNPVQARTERDKIRNFNAFRNAWVLYYKTDPNETVELTHEIESVSTTDKQLDVVVAEEEVDGPIVEEEIELEEPEPEPEDDSYRVYVNAYDARTMREVKGQAEFIDLKKNFVFEKISVHKMSKVMKPLSGNTRVTALVEVFGYQPKQVTFDLENPTEGSNDVHLDRNAIVLDFELTRILPGDITTMYNVYFYDDAAVMKSTSIYELNELVTMMEENEEYEIVIHGHTNGNAAGKLIKANTEAGDFFNITPENDVTVGTAKQLSQERAEVIKEYLVSKGINSKRMKTKGWGGKKPLYDKNSSDAYLNARVEVEVEK